MAADDEGSYDKKLNTAERFPADLVLTVDDFRTAGWHEAIETANEHCYLSYWQSLSKSAIDA